MSRSPPHEAGRQDQGVVAPATAVLLAVLVGMVGLVTDVGVWFYQRRDLQAATDAAALAAASRLATDASTAQAVAVSFLASNGYSSAFQSFETGYYCPDSTLAAAQRFQAARCSGDPVSTPLNAVRLTTSTTAPLFLSRAVLGAAASDKAISVKATAARIDVAGMEAGTGLVSLDLANKALSSLVGGSGVSLTAVQYEGLVSARVDTLELLDALAVTANVSAGTYSQVLASSLSAGDILDAAAQVMAAHPEVAGASAAVAGLQVVRAQITGSPQISLGQLVDLGMWEKMRVGHAGQSPSALQAGLGLYQLTTFTLQLANQRHAVTIPQSTLGVPNLASLTIQASAIEPPTQAYFTYGPVGGSVHTAAVRMQLALSLLPSLGLGSSLSLPLYVEVAGGDASLTAINCPLNGSTTATVLARGGVADVYIGTLSSSRSIDNFSTPITSADITSWEVSSSALSSGLLGSLLSLLGLSALLNEIISISVSAHLDIGSPTDTTLTFTSPTGVASTGSAITTSGWIGRPPSDRRGYSPAIQARATSRNMTAGILDGLAETLQINIRSCFLGFGGACSTTLKVGAAAGTLFTTLRPLLTNVDDVLDPLLQSLGLTVGYTDVFVTGVRCGAPVLVN